MVPLSELKRTWRTLAVTALVLTAPTMRAGAGEADRLLGAYPDHLSHIEGNDLVWRDGTRMVIDDGRGPKGFEQRLSQPDLKDMLIARYPTGRTGLPPQVGELIDPGRVRHAAFFSKMYGDCTSGAAARNLVEIVWLANTAPQRLKVTKVNGVAKRLQAVSRDLEQLPRTLRRYLSPSAGSYVCRPIAGTSRGSAHGYGIAIDIALPRADYWRWRPVSTRSRPTWKNRIPLEIVDVFERHGFIWGGKWVHYDTMHFEYRPELLPLRR